MTYIIPNGCKIRALTERHWREEGTVIYYNPWRKTYLVRFETGGRPEYEFYELKDLEMVK